MDYASWVAFVHDVGGVPVTWPYAGDAYGWPAARFTASSYASALVDGVVNGAERTQTTPDGSYVYVAWPDVTGTPHTMTTGERVENAVFSAGDRTADAIGLPSLDTLKKLLDVGGYVLTAVALIGLLKYASSARPK